MSDERDLTPEQEARVARLLADARHDEPIPDEVAARLDRVLAGLSSEHVPGPDEQYPAVVDLAARRRRRAAGLLVAAAAVIVAAVGIGQVVGGDDGATDDAGGGSSITSEEERAADGGPGAAGPAKPNEMSESELEALGAPARVTTRSFASDVRRLQDRAGFDNADESLVSGEQLAAPEMDFTCGRTVLPAGKLIAVEYNGSPAVLVYQTPGGGTQVVELVQCGSGETLRSTTIPLP